MNYQEDEKRSNEIWKAYGKYLDSQGIEYNNRNGFHVRIPLKHTDKSFIHVGRVFDGLLNLADYCGTCYTGIRMAKKVMKAIKERYPEADVYVERFGGTFELDVQHKMKYTTVEELHEQVLKIAEIVDWGAKIGYDMLGEDFER